MSLKEKLLILIFGLVFFSSAVIRFEQTKNGQFPFTYDQARDMLDIRVLGEFKDLWVMGPTTSINTRSFLLLLNAAGLLVWRR